ncbi:hypothetical protein M9H77_24309 [Catharanthus roseus]|uniref:Uncharacterized protein n=1 Tax=Catharanthus roseus TaxID=4058 RepID=A0ACC0AWN2_CATRO|nr:hypothetical protein M9H77_24309 [Catharanthus roseus]
MAEHGRIYKNETGKAMRFKIFAENYKHIESANNKAGNSSYKLGLNFYADLTNEEFQSYAFGYLHQKSPHHHATLNVLDIEIQLIFVDSIDWRLKGAVTHIKNQGGCALWFKINKENAIQPGQLLKFTMVADELSLNKHKFDILLV